MSGAAPTSGFAPRSAAGARIALDGHTLGSGAGGNESYVAGLLEGLEASGFPGEVVLYTAPTPPSHPGRGAAGMRVIERRVRSRNPALRLAWELPAALRRDGVQLAHFQYVGPLRSPCPLTLAVHDTSFLLAPELLPRATALRLRAMTGWALRRAAAVVVPSAWTAESLTARYPEAADRVHVVPLAAAAAFTRAAPSAEPAPVLDASSLSLPRRFCLYAGRRQRRKNVDLLLRAYAAAAGRDAAVPPLVLVGPPAAGDAGLRRAATALGIADRLVWAGYVTKTELARAYRRADFFCFPCRFEGFGLPVAEALACGCPVLAADEGGVPETLGGAGRLLPADSVPAWAEAIVALSRDAEARADLARRGIARARRLSWSRTATGWLDAARAAGCL